MGARGRSERGKKKMPDKGKLTDSVRGDSRAGEDMSDGFYRVREEVRIVFTKSIGVDRTKVEFMFLSGKKVVKELGAK